MGAPFPVSAFVAMLASLEMGSQAHFKEHGLHSHVLPHDSVGVTHYRLFPEGILLVLLLDSLDIFPSVRVCVKKEKSVCNHERSCDLCSLSHKIVLHTCH